MCEPCCAARCPKRGTTEYWASSAEAAFWQLLSLPPLILASIASLGYVANWFGPDTVTRVQAQIEAALSRGFSSEFVNETIAPTLNEVLHGQRAGLISIGFILALWAGSSGTATYVNTITIAYDMRDQRGAVRSRLLALGLFLGMVLIGGVIALPLLVLSPSSGRQSLSGDCPRHGSVRS